MVKNSWDKRKPHLEWRHGYASEHASKMIESLRHSFARYRLHYPIYFFHHLPKCGGTSVRQALEQWFHVNDDYYNERADVNLPPIDLSTLSLNCICGHFGHEGYFIDQRYPKIFTGFRAAKRYRAFMFLRDPLEMRCSLYRHEVKLGRQSSPDLATAIMLFNNFYARIINVDEGNWQQRIDQYFFVGLADDLQLSFDLLAKLLNKPHVVLPKTNTTIVEHASSAKSLTAEQTASFMSENALDYEIFQYVQNRVDELRDRLAI
jgi:hypothetical protein